MFNIEEQIADLVVEAVQTATSTTDRALQQADFRLGMSDLGHCREYARRMIIQEPPSDERDKTAAYLGSILGAGLESSLAHLHPDWIFQAETVTTLPSGIQILGHPDVIAPGMVLDLKSKDGFEIVKKMGQTLQQRFQLHGYAAAAIDAGLVEEEGLIVADVFFDRSGGEPRPYVIAEPFDRGVLEQIDLWLEDVLYAVRHGEETGRDKPRDFCERYCEYFTNCRLYDTDASGLIEAPEHVSAMEVYLEGMALEREGKKKKDEAKKALTGVSGSTGTHFLRWVEIGSTTVPEYTRAAYQKIDIRAVKK